MNGQAEDRRGPLEAYRRREDQFVADARANVDTIRGMGMIGDLRRHWHGAHINTIEATRHGSDVNASFAVLSRTLRLIVQSSILGIGAYLTMQNALSSGALIACSIIFARALAPVDQALRTGAPYFPRDKAGEKLCSVATYGTADEERIRLRPPSRSFAVSGLGSCVAGSQESRFFPAFHFAWRQVIAWRSSAQAALASHPSCGLSLGRLHQFQARSVSTARRCNNGRMPHAPSTSATSPKTFN